MQGVLDSLQELSNLSWPYTFHRHVNTILPSLFHYCWEKVYLFYVLKKIEENTYLDLSSNQLIVRTGDLYLTNVCFFRNWCKV